MSSLRDVDFFYDKFLLILNYFNNMKNKYK